MVLCTDFCATLVIGSVNNKTSKPVAISFVSLTLTSFTRLLITGVILC